MSLLDDVSIVVTPNGYKAGRLYGVLPTYTEGSELVVNGDFATDSVWTKGTGWTISGGKASYDDVTTNAKLSQSLTITANKRYNVKFTVSNASSYARINIGDAFGSTDYIGTNNYVNGSYDLNFSNASTHNTFAFTGYTDGSSFDIDNISVKEVTSSDMDVTRATAATRVDENGLVNYAEVLGSELVTNGDFDSNITGWSAKDCTIAWDNGKLKADNSSGNANGGAFQNIGLVTGKTYQMTATMQLLTGSSNGTFNLFTSAAGGTGQTSVYTGSALVVGGAAVTETFYFIPGSGDVSIQFTCDEANATYTIDNVSVKEVTRNNVPRIDYTGGGCPHILSEPQRTNIVTYSEAIGSNSFNPINSSIVADQTTSPDGTLNADLLRENTANDVHVMIKDFNLSSGQAYSISVFAKSNGVNRNLRFDGGGVGWSSSFGINFDLTNGTASSGGVIESFGNGWFRCSVTATTNATTSRLLVYSILNSTTTYQGDGSSGVFLYGLQIEAGSYATSYIPTSGSSVTRNQDLFTRDGIASLINSTEGVLFAEIASLSSDVDSEARIVLAASGDTDNSLRLYYNTTQDTIEYKCRVGGANVCDITHDLGDSTLFHKIACKWKVNDFALWVDGVEVGTDTSGSSFSSNTLNTLNFANAANTSDFFFGKAKQLQVYKTELTDLQIESITSWTSFTEMANALNYTIY